MQNSKKSAKSKGVVLFAFNTAVDYVKIADRASKLIEHTLQLPVTLITDKGAEPKFSYDHVINVDAMPATFRAPDGSVQWRNRGRFTAYELSPYEQTLLLDSDYLMLDRSLLTILKTTVDYKLMHHSYTANGMKYAMMGETSLPYVWATVVAFNKTPLSEMLFDMVGRIQRNYQYYRALYNIREVNFRNDYAFAIANNILSGYNTNESQGIPWPMFTIDEDIESIPLITKDFLHVRHQKSGIVMPRQNKQYLLSDDFEKVIEVICDM
jgi:hypothetical protein